MPVPITSLTADKQGHSTNAQSSRRSAWERWEIWVIVFYLSLALPTVLALVTGNLRYPPWLVLGLSLTLGAWYALIMLWRIPKASSKGQVRWSVIFLIGGFALWFPLSRSHWAYYITASSFYGMMWGTLPFPLAVVGNVILTGLIIWSQSLNLNQPITLSLDLLLIGTVTVGWAALLAYWMRSIIRESAERKSLIEQLESAQDSLAAAERQAGVLQERQRLAQDIHDTLAQGFTSIVMQLEAAEQILPDGMDPVRDHIQCARDTARISLTEARRLVLALRPVQLEGTPLVEALSRVADRWEQESGVKTSFAVTGTAQALHPEVEVTLLRALQEALTNVHKHAQAGQVNVTLSYMDDQVAMDIQDDGKGFNPQKPAYDPDQVSGGFGIATMHERVARLKGEVIIESHPDQGTTVAIQIPMEIPE
jgi:signal transduction histidine kinase